MHRARKWKVGEGSQSSSDPEPGSPSLSIQLVCEIPDEECRGTGYSIPSAMSAAEIALVA